MHVGRAPHPCTSAHTYYIMLPRLSLIWSPFSILTLSMLILSISLSPIAWTPSFLLSVSFSLPLRRQLDYKVLRCYRKSRCEPGYFSLASGSRPSKGQIEAKVLHDLRPRTEGGYNQAERQQWERSSRRCWFPLCIHTQRFCFSGPSKTFQSMTKSPKSLLKVHENKRTRRTDGNKNNWDTCRVCTSATLCVCEKGWKWLRMQLSWPVCNPEKMHRASRVLCLNTLGLQPNWDQGGLRHV